MNVEQARLARAINAARVAHDRDALARYLPFFWREQAHARAMRRKGRLWHDPTICAGLPFRVCGEIVGAGWSVDRLIAAWLAHAEHRVVLLGAWDHFGVGAVSDSDGALWAAVAFGRT